MDIHDSARYATNGTAADAEWAALIPSGGGIVHMGTGPNMQPFMLSMFHQLHCLRLIRSGLAGDYRAPTQGHFGHCLNYLRQMILCKPDLTLEPGDVLERDFSVERQGSVHVCEDWRQVYDMMQENWDDWARVKGGFENRTMVMQ